MCTQRVRSHVRECVSIPDESFSMDGRVQMRNGLTLRILLNYCSSLFRSSFEGKANYRVCVLHSHTVCCIDQVNIFMNVAPNNLFISIKKALEPIQMVVVYKV